MKSQKQIKDKIIKLHIAIAADLDKDSYMEAAGHEFAIRVLKWVLK